jgi:hypothetical protein
MKYAIVPILCACLASPALASLISSHHYSSMAEVQQHVIGGFDFYARGDTEKLRETRTSPFAQQELAFPLWNDGIAHGFKVVYNASGIAGISIDDLYSITMPVTINPLTDGLLVTACATAPGSSVQVSNLKLTLPGMVIYDVGSTANAPPTDYLLIDTELPLINSFILSGTVTFNWSGSLPPPDQQWFEVTNVVMPEPAAGTLLAAGGLLTGVLRRRS